MKKLTDSCLRIPELIASAHSRRFETGDELKLYVRRKIFNLYKAWKGFKKTSIGPVVEKSK